MTGGTLQFLHVVGARPNFMKAAPVIRALGDRGATQLLVHTGQHYDVNMSDVFFRDLGMPAPDVFLGVGSGSHAAQTAAIMIGFERTLIETGPTRVVVYGDVNSTLAASLVAVKRHVPVAHVEAGLRSFDPDMPEEINRRVTDQVSDLLFVTAPEGVENLRAEGIWGSRVHFVGNPMIDTLLANLARFDVDRAREALHIVGPYAVATVHRPSNVDDPAAARRVVEMLVSVAAQMPLVLPLHPRGRASLLAAGLEESDRLLVTEPLGYVDFLSLVRGSELVITDSGGIQEETTVLGVPCLTIRRNTERPITISHGTNRLIEPEDVAAAVTALGQLAGTTPPGPPLWDGHAGDRIADVLMSQGDPH